MVRDLAAKLGKKVELVTHGEATELDKGMIEKITDPLTHLVRNAATTASRCRQSACARGKPETGTHHAGGLAPGRLASCIEVSDDGQGLSRDKLLAKARERGLHAPDSDERREV